ncbi:AbiU2 domain-containing protein [Ramlibacter sp. AN1133]|uniref:AbiU2 domain-containing protein n=1 Tax=Ramlibacter sp. AN1133 TaxID=3133429 RepID=UPI0030C50009
MIRIADGKEFNRLVEALADDIQHAHFHWRLYRDLLNAHEEFPNVRHQSVAFWHLTHRAHVMEAMQSLARAFDQDATSLHLRSWLKTIQANMHLFATQEFKKRLAGNPFVDSLSEIAREPDPVQLEADIALCTQSDPTVKALLLQRHNVTAHRNARMAARGRSAIEEFGIPVADFEDLLQRSRTIHSRYSQLFAAASYSPQILGHGDYRFIFQCVEETVRRSREESTARGRGPI